MTRSTIFLTIFSLFLPFCLHAGLGQGTLDYSLRQNRIQNKMYSGSGFFKDSKRTSKYPKINYNYSRNQARISQFSRNLNTKTQQSRYQSKVIEQKRSFWDKLTSKDSSKTYTSPEFPKPKRFTSPGLSFQHHGRFSEFNNTVRLQNPEKRTQRISAGDINKFVDPRSPDRNQGASTSQGFIPIQGPARVIPIK